MPNHVDRTVLAWSLLLCVTGSCPAGDTWEILSGVGAGRRITATWFVDENTGWLATDDGALVFVEECRDRWAHQLGVGGYLSDYIAKTGLHELGHVLGLSHNTDPSSMSVMTAPTCDVPQADFYFSPSEVAAIRLADGSPAPAADSSACIGYFEPSKVHVPTVERVVHIWHGWREMQQAADMPGAGVALEEALRSLSIGCSDISVYRTIGDVGRVSVAIGSRDHSVLQDTDMPRGAWIRARGCPVLLDIASISGALYTGRLLNGRACFNGTGSIQALWATKPVILEMTCRRRQELEVLVPGTCRLGEIGAERSDVVSELEAASNIAFLMEELR